jgi:GR25 family glycosyltransferase involved in LPS biosynthesis
VTEKISKSFLFLNLTIMSGQDNSARQTVREFLISMYPQCISMIDTPERYECAVKNLDVMELTPHVVFHRPARCPATEGGGIAGCRRSHLAVIQKALAVQPPLSKFVVFEDDLVWTDQAVEALHRLKLHFDKNPNFNFEMIRLYTMQPQPLSKNADIPFLTPVFGTSTLAYIMSRSFAERVMKANLDDYHLHVDFQLSRMSCLSYVLNPQPIQVNNTLPSTITWGQSIPAVMMQDVYQKLLTPQIVDTMHNAWTATQQTVGFYKPSKFISFLGDSQPNVEHSRRFIKTVGVPLQVYDDMYEQR